MIRSMQVKKRNGTLEKVSFDKIISRIDKICVQLNLTRIDPIEIAKLTINGLYNGVTTEELDMFASKICAQKTLDDPEYNKLASGICISNLHKSTTDDFLELTQLLYNNVDKFGKSNPLVTEEYLKFVKTNIDTINSNIDYNRDYLFDFFGIQTLLRAYLHRIKTPQMVVSNDDDKTKTTIKNYKQTEQFLLKRYGKIVERPQHLFMRIALSMHADDINSAIETYHLMSQKYFTHASPTMFNSASPYPQLSSCFLLSMEDSMEGICRCSNHCCYISKMAGGIGIDISNIRASGSLIRKTNGDSDGIVPLARWLSAGGKYVNQSGRRNGAIAIYMEPWHGDIREFCDLRKNTGAEDLRARDIFLGLWINDIFMEAVENDDYWYLMCPDECKGLTDTYGKQFEQLYNKYIDEGRYREKIKAKDLWFHIISAQIDTGMPYMCYKDTVNERSNQKNIGTVRSSNLCTEIVEVSTPDEIAVCNLASICLPSFVKTDKNNKKYFDFELLSEVTSVVTKNLNKVIDINYYPVPEAKKSNMRHRPIGIGIQGLCDVFCLLDLQVAPCESIIKKGETPEQIKQLKQQEEQNIQDARLLNKKIFETMYYSALKTSNELAIKDKEPYSTFKGSPLSEGIFHFEMYGLTENQLNMNFDWSSLRKSIMEHGVKNSLLIALMPTASTSQIMGNSEGIECYTTNLYNRTTLAGEFVVINPHLIETLIKMNLWTQDVRNEFLYYKGSVQEIDEIPDNIKRLYQTNFEMSMKPILNLAIDRSPFVDQAQSLNLFAKEPDFQQLTNFHFYGWKGKLKTGMYYLRSKPATNALHFGLDQEIIDKILEKKKCNNKTVNVIKENVTTTNTVPQQNNSVPVEDNYVPCESCSS